MHIYLIYQFTVFKVMNMTLETNDTTANIPGKEETICWTIFHVLIVLLSLIGDTLILIGTTRHKAIKLHRVIIVVIQHLAVSNLLLTLFRVVPTIVSLVAGDWVMGMLLCLVNLNVVVIVTPVTAILTCILSTFKTLIVQYPLKTHTWTRRRAHIVCALCWLTCVIRPRQIMNVFYASTESFFFDYIQYMCLVDLTSTPISFVRFQNFFIYFSFMVVLVVMIVTSVLLLFKARQAAVRDRQSVRWQGVLVVGLTTGVILVSYLPDTIVPMIDNLTSVHPSSSIKPAACFFDNVNIVANFFVYSLAVKSFRVFLSTRIRQLIFQQSPPSTPASAHRVRVERGMGSQRNPLREPFTQNSFV